VAGPPAAFDVSRHFEFAQTRSVLGQPESFSGSAKAVTVSQRPLLALGSPPCGRPGPAHANNAAALSGALSAVRLEARAEGEVAPSHSARWVGAGKLCSPADTEARAWAGLSGTGDVDSGPPGSGSPPARTGPGELTRIIADRLPVLDSKGSMLPSAAQRCFTGWTRTPGT
jgi:hypothetical protein